MNTTLDIPRFYERYRIGALRPRLPRRSARSATAPQLTVETIVTTPTAETGRPRTVVPLVVPAEHAPEPTTTRQPDPADAPVPDGPTCRCGFGVGHHFIRPRCEFTGAGWVLITIGVNPPPRAVRLECAVCGDILERITDRDRIDEMQW